MIRLWRVEVLASMFFGSISWLILQPLKYLNYAVSNGQMRDEFGKIHAEGRYYPEGGTDENKGKPQS